MNRESVEVLKQAYKPYKYTIQGSCHILKSTSGDVVIKEKKNDMNSLYQYLENRGFSSFPKLVDDSRNGVNVFEYVEEYPLPLEQKAEDMILLVAKLHSQTSYEKDVTTDDFRNIYYLIHEKIDYLKYYYESLYDEYFKSIYPSPHEYFLLTNYSKIYAALMYSSQKLETWYSHVKDLKKYRVCQIHHNLKLEHYINGEKNCLISWEHSTKDSPVLDIILFYQNNYFDLNFQDLLEKYFNICPWSNEEKELFNAVISIPFKFEEKGSEFEIVKQISKVLDYVYKTEELISAEQVKQDTSFINEK